MIQTKTVLITFMNLNETKMKNHILLLATAVLFGAGVLTSCNKDKEPAYVIEGIYTGSFEGLYLGDDTLNSSTYQVEVTALNDNKVSVFGKNFEKFEVLVTTNGLNVEAVSKSDPYLTDFIYIGNENKLKFTFNKGANEAKFIGIK